MDSVIRKTEILVQALPYMRRFRDSVMVIKFGGSTMEDASVIDRTMRDIVLLQSIGIKPVVVHGGGKAISAKLKVLDIPTRFVDGLRYTCERTIDVVDDVLHNEVNPALVAKTAEHGGIGKMISGKSVLCAHKLVRKADDGSEIEYGFVGDVVSVDAGPIHLALAEGVIPIITPLAQDENGQAYNINADVAACKIAQAIPANKLVFLSDVPGILRDPKDEHSLIPTIYVREVDSYIADGTISGGMIPKVKSAVEAIVNGVQKVHMIDGRINHALLLEVFTDRGVGTEIFRVKGPLPPKVEYLPED